jgi:GTP-binding protein
MDKIQSAEFVRSAHSGSDFLRDGRPEVAFVGRSNVGKSSLLNALLGRRGLARTSSTPGRTQAVNYFLVDDRLWFVDLPGYGYAKASKDSRKRWGRTIELYFEQALPEALVVLLIDAKVAGTALDAAAWSFFAGRGVTPIVVATKIDKVARGRRAPALGELRGRVGLPEGHPVIELSVETGEGLKELWRAITERVRQGPGGGTDHGATGRSTAAPARRRRPRGTRLPPGPLSPGRAESGSRSEGGRETRSSLRLRVPRGLSR